MKTAEAQIDYKTHILIGLRADGVMSIIDDWPHVPLQSVIEKAIADARGSYVAFALCTPTSILPGKRGVEETKTVVSRFGLPAAARRP
jgi:hypothetical protein